MGVFEKRINLKPLEHPELYDFVDAINHNYWIFSEYNYDGDINDYHTKLLSSEKEAFKRTVLAISQIEVNVKRFWANLYNQFPKPEFDALGCTFADSEVRHQRFYSNLLELLGLNEEFEKLNENPIIQDRIDYLTKYLKYAGSNNKEQYTLTLILFSLFIEFSSLFSQFLIIKSFNKEKNLFKGMDNGISATRTEENLHGLAGAHIIKLIKKENPEWFNEEFYRTIEKATKKAYEAECKIIDWIFEEGELSFLSKNVVYEFIKDRLNQSLELVECNKVFDINKDMLKSIEWFNIETLSETHIDFFHKTPVSYSKKAQSITALDIF